MKNKVTAMASRCVSPLKIFWIYATGEEASYMSRKLLKNIENSCYHDKGMAAFAECWLQSEFFNHMSCETLPRERSAPSVKIQILHRWPKLQRSAYCSATCTRENE